MICHDAESSRLMSALGQKRTLDRGPAMTASPPRADMLIVGINVCYVPEPEVCCVELRFSQLSWRVAGRRT